MLVSRIEGDSKREEKGDVFMNCEWATTAEFDLWVERSFQVQPVSLVSLSDFI